MLAQVGVEVLGGHHSLSDFLGVGIDKVDNPFVVIGILVILAVTLNDLEGVEVNLYRFNYPAVYPRRENKGVGFGIVA